VHRADGNSIRNILDILNQETDSTTLEEKGSFFYYDGVIFFFFTKMGSVLKKLQI